MFKKYSLLFLNKCWQLIALSLILLAVLITVARYMLPSINDYRSSLEELIAANSNVQVKIGSISGSWESLGPVLEIHNVQFGLLSEQVNSASIKSIKINISTIPSLFYRTLITDKLIIEGLHLAIKQEITGQFALANLPNEAKKDTEIDPNFTSAIQNWLQHQKEIYLVDVLFDISLRNGHLYPIHLDHIRLDKGNSIYQLIGHSKLPGNNQIDIVFEADDFLNNPSTVGQLYINTHKIDMSKLPLNAIWEEADISSGFLEMEIWADWKNSQFQSALISLNVDEFLMSLMGETQTPLNKLKSFLVWQRQTDGWIFESQQTEIISQQREWPDPSLSIVMQRQDKHKNYNISASRLDLGIWADLILANPNLDSNSRQQLLKMNPNGFLNDSQVVASVAKNQLLTLRANARFSELTWQPWKSIPGVTNLAGQFEIHENSGQLIVDSRDSKLDYPSLFRWPFTLSSINSRFSWEFTDELISLNLSNLSLDAKDAQLLADGLFTINRKSGDVNLNLYAEVDNGNVAQTKTFLPYSIMSESLVSYLDQSIKNGHLSSTQIALRGLATNFPFASPEGVFAINAKASDTRFVFADDWPVISNITADLWFVEDSMDIFITEAKSNGQQISAAAISIEEFGATVPLLTVNTLSSGETEDGIDYLNNSPLQDSVGTVFNVIPTQGPFELALDLSIPLDNPEDIIVNGKVKLLGNTMELKPLDMPIKNIVGTVTIQDSIVSAENISGDLIEGKSILSLQQEINSEGLLLTKLTSNGNITASGLRTIFPDIIPPLISGTTDYNLTLLLPELVDEIDSSDLIVDLNIESNLKGIISNYPVPFAKKAEQTEGLNFNFQLLNNNQKLYSARLSEIIDMKLHSSTDSLPTGRVVFGGDKASISSNEGIELTGNLSNFDLESWLNLKQPLLEESSELQSITQPSIAEAALRIADYEHFYINDLLIDKLTYYFLNFDKVKVSAVEENKVFLFDLSSEEIQGAIKIPDPSLDLPIKINLKSLSIADQFPETDEQSEVSTSMVREPSSSSLPYIDLYCEKCIYNKQDVGPTKLKISPLVNGNEFTVTMTGNDILDINIKGDWKKENEQVTTRLNGNLNTTKLGALFSLFNYKSGVHKTKLKLNGELEWLGDPGQFNVLTLSGHFKFDAGKGSQENISDRKARIFSIFSVGSLARRLTLDFSDLFGDGFYYNGFEGDFDIDNGRFTTSNFEIDGTSADMAIKGVSDFNNKRIENCILVSPELSSSLPILAGWAIEPMTGLLVYLMSKIFEPAIKVITSIQYKIEGSFENPVVTEIGKTEGTAMVDTTGEVEKRIITEDPNTPKFSCDGVFKN